MKGEIRFRAWDGKLGVWASSGWKIDSNGLMILHIGPANVEDTEYSVHRFTGLKDKNGNEIYEGDIIAHNERTYVVEWYVKVCGFLLVDRAKNKQQKWWRDGSWLWRVSPHLKIIGNVYENPELIPK